MPRGRLGLCLFAACLALAAPPSKVPKVWDEAALARWLTPLAGLNARPTHLSEAEYYSLPVENLRSYPVYFPDREPPGYWEKLQHLGPQSLIEPEKLKTEADWIAAGERVFEEADHFNLRIFDPILVAQVRARGFLLAQGTVPFPDGTLDLLRWVPTPRGIALSVPGCAGCHVLHRADGTQIIGAPSLAEVSRIRPYKYRGVSARFLEPRVHALTGAPPFTMGGPFEMWLYQAYGAPWILNDPNARLKNFTRAEYDAFVSAARYGGAITRWNGSILYPAKIPDLIGIKERRYIDHTATHLHREIGDLMRYAAQVSFAEMTDFGSYHMLSPETKRIGARLPDEALYALALYIYSLKPPRNPNPFDQRAQAGQKIFRREGCPMCHTPPLYTNNKITLARGFARPQDAPVSLDILPVSVGTDPGLALATRKGTGYYKVPSLQGVWYRGHYLHDGSAASLEEMFDPDRLKETHVPEGWSPPGTKTRAIPGHPFGLGLKPEERKQLLAFLRTL